MNIVTIENNGIQIAYLSEDNGNSWTRREGPFADKLSREEFANDLANMIKHQWEIVRFEKF